MSVYRILEHASPDLINAAPSADGSPPIFLAIIGHHWQDTTSALVLSHLKLSTLQGPCQNHA